MQHNIAGKDVLFLNIMWRYLEQQSFTVGLLDGAPSLEDTLEYFAI